MPQEPGLVHMDLVLLVLGVFDQVVQEPEALDQEVSDQEVLAQDLEDSDQGVPA